MKSKDSKSVSNNNSEKKAILSVVYIFVGLFVLMMGYFTYFLLVKRDDVVNSTYNLRHDVLSKELLEEKFYHQMVKF